MKWQGNKQAHISAKYAKEINNTNNFITWIEENPPLIESVITHDLLNLVSS